MYYINVRTKDDIERFLSLLCKPLSAFYKFIIIFMYRYTYYVIIIIDVTADWINK